MSTLRPPTSTNPCPSSTIRRIRAAKSQFPHTHAPGVTRAARSQPVVAPTNLDARGFPERREGPVSRCQGPVLFSGFIRQRAAPSFSFCSFHPTAEHTRLLAGFPFLHLLPGCGKTACFCNWLSDQRMASFVLFPQSRFFWTCGTKTVYRSLNYNYRSGLKRKGRSILFRRLRIFGG